MFPKWALPDPQEQNSKLGRPYVLLSNEAGIIKEPFVFIVAISDLDKATPGKYVSLSYGAGSTTGLEKPCAAICDWVFRIATTDLEPPTIRCVENSEFLQIYNLVKSIRPPLRDADDYKPTA